MEKRDYIITVILSIAIYILSFFVSIIPCTKQSVVLNPPPPEWSLCSMFTPRLGVDVKFFGFFHGGLPYSFDAILSFLLPFIYALLIGFLVVIIYNKVRSRFSEPK